MKPDKILLLCTLLCIATSCGLCKHTSAHSETDVKDSLSFHTTDSTSVKDEISVRDSTVSVPLPVESSQSVMPVILPSHLETSLAESDAYVDSLGLHHTLKNKETEVEVHVPVTEHYHYESHTHLADSTAMHSDSEKETVIEYVDKPLTWWEMFRIRAFWPLLLACLLLLVWTFRKWIFKI